MSLLDLPPRRNQQSLNAYVRDNLERLEQEVSAGVPYEALLNMALAAGFSKIAVLSLHSAMYRARKGRPKRIRVPTQQSAGRSWLSRSKVENESSCQPEDDRVLLARRYRQLTRAPRPGTDEPDSLV
jgi:hypothetical protein